MDIKADRGMDLKEDMEEDLGMVVDMEGHKDNMQIRDGVDRQASWRLVWGLRPVVAVWTLVYCFKNNTIIWKWIGSEREMLTGSGEGSRRSRRVRKKTPKLEGSEVG